MKKPKRKYFTEAEYVVAHAEYKAKKGKNPSMRYKKIVNARAALKAAKEEVIRFNKWKERFYRDIRIREWEKSIGLVPRDPFARKVPHTCYNYY